MKVSIKNKLICWLFAIAFSCVLAFTGVNAFKTVAKADFNWKTDGVFEMDDGVSLRLGGKSGLRFIIRMDETVATFVKDNAEVELGVIISTHDRIEKTNDYINIDKKVGGAIDKNKIYQDGDYYFANACISNIKANNLKKEFTAVAYIKKDDEIRYTEYNSLARNNLYDTVNMAMLNGYYEGIRDSKDPNENSIYFQTGENVGWYGSADYPIVVENSTDYDKIVDIANENDLSQYTVLVKENVETNKVIVSETKPSIFVESVYEVNKLIEELPDSVTMPDGIGVIGRIRDVEKKYNALSDGNKEQVDNYAKVESLLASIEGYDRVYKNDASDGTVIPSYVPGGFSSPIGGSATTRQDAVYGNVLTVESNADGKAALSFTNFPSIEKYAKIYFYVKVSVACDIYLSDGTTNDGWGENWKNTWSTSGFWCNANTWRLIEIDVANDGYIGTNFALGFRTNTTGFTFEISDFYGYTDAAPEETSLMFGTQVDSGETNEYGKIYNISREQWYIDNNNVNTIGTLQANKLANALPSGYETFYFWMYNGTDTEYNFHLAGDVSGTWTDSADSVALKVGEWTKVTISAEDIALNKNGQWYVYILGGDGAGAAKDGWKISTIYAGPYVEYVYTDHADVKNVIA
ncbi:MAG: hypothetical protein E7360_03645, partial [Clostridiales bacterium]|nr:hypothetical protein [Clostridiales bacterium]